MGNMLRCDRCDLSSATSVFTFSEAVVLKLSEGVSPEPEKEVIGKPRDLNDREWIEKLKCIDSVHTNVYGLSADGFNMLFNRVRQDLEHAEISSFNEEKEKIKQCYKEHESSPLDCEKTINEFVDSVDLKRLQIMVKKVRKSEQAEEENNHQQKVKPK